MLEGGRDLDAYVDLRVIMNQLNDTDVEKKTTNEIVG